MGPSLRCVGVEAEEELDPGPGSRRAEDPADGASGPVSHKTRLLPAPGASLAPLCRGRVRTRAGTVCRGAQRAGVLQAGRRTEGTAAGVAAPTARGCGAAALRTGVPAVQVAAGGGRSKRGSCALWWRRRVTERRGLRLGLTSPGPRSAQSVEMARSQVRAHSNIYMFRGK